MGKFSYANRIIHDTHPHAWLSFSKILQVSSNIGFTKVADMLKKERYFRYIEKFGFGRVTGIDLPGEVPGLLRRPDTWAAIDLATHAFGQGISTTPMQMAMAYAAIANGGFLMRPYVTRRVAAMLTEVTGEGGTGTMAKIEGFEVAGKTGTAQKVDPVHGGYSAKKRVASFVGFVPAHDPRLVALVLIDEPELSVYGGVVAAPVFRNIAQGALRRLAVAPQKGLAIPATASPGQAALPRERSALRTPDDSMVVAEGEVPDFMGLSMREALEKAQSINVKIKLQGNGYVVRQAPAAGGRWADDGLLVLKLQG